MTKEKFVKCIGGTGREYNPEEERKEFKMRMDFIQEDMGYETFEEFKKDYDLTKYPVSKSDIEWLNMLIQKELAWIWKFHREKNTPINFEHVQFSMLETIGRFEEAIDQREAIITNKSQVN